MQVYHGEEEMLHAFLKKLGMVALISYVIEILMFLVLWQLMGYAFWDAAKISWLTSWPILPLIPVAIYFVKKRYRG